MKSWIKVLVVLVCVFTSLSTIASSQPFTIDALNALKQGDNATNKIVVFWSLECPPCFRELSIIQQHIKQLDPERIVLINTDDEHHYGAERDAVITEFELQQTHHFYVAGNTLATIRQAIDPNWHGELPRTYFIDQNGQWHGKSGVFSETLLLHWLN